MSLAQKTLFIMLAILLALACLLWVVLRHTLLKDFHELEREKVQRNVAQARAACEDELTRLKSVAGDWAAWDETYDFARGLNDAYLEENMMDVTFTNLRVSLMLLYDRSGRLLYGKSLDLAPPAREIPLPPELLDLAVSHPILRNDDSGPVQGTYIAGLFLTPRQVEGLRKKTSLAISLKPFAAVFPPLPPSVREALQREEYAAHPLDREAIAGYALLRDFSGRPALLLEVLEERSIFQKGLGALRYNILSALTLIGIMGMLLYFLLDRFVLTPLLTLAKDLDAVRASQDLSRRVPVRGRDEIARLGGSVNDLLANLEGSRSALKAGEQRYFNLIQTIPHGIAELSPRGTITFANAAFHRMHDCDGQDLAGASMLDFTADESRGEGQSLELFLHELFARKAGPGSWYGRNRTRDGRLIDVRMDWSHNRAPGGEATGFIAVLTDITREREAEARLRRQKDQLQGILDNSTSAIFVKDRQGRFILVNERWKDLFGMEKSRLVGKRDTDLVPPPVASRFREQDDHIFSTGESMTMEENLRLKGEERTFITTKFPLTTPGGPPYAVCGIATEVTEMKRMERALRESEERYRSFVENFQGIAFRGDLQFKPIFCHGAVEAITGYTEEDLVNGTPRWSALIHPEDFEAVIVPSSKDLVETPGHKTEREYRIVRKDGEMRWVREFIRNICDEHGRPAFVQGALYEITRHKELEEQREQLLTAIDQAAESIILADESETIRYVNPAFESASGYKREEVLGRKPGFLLPEDSDPALCAAVRETLSRGEVWKGLVAGRTKDGGRLEEAVTVSPVRDSSGRIGHYVTVKRDVTEEARLERQSRQSQKMEAVGTLAGGIAHDFNNILGGVFLSADLALSKLDRSHPARPPVARILKAAHRARDLVKQLLAFSRRTPKARKPLYLSPIIKETLKLLRASLPSTIRMETRLDPACHAVKGDAVELHQILMNLCVNAAQAMEERGGVLEVRLRNADRNEGPSPLPGPGQSGPGIRLDVRDTGCGVPPEIQDRIFDPFFTTKERRGGTGMGLAVVHGLVNEYGGSVRVESEPGKGSLFSLWLPAASEIPARESEPVEARLGGDESVLLVDDEKELVELWTEILREHGYRVTGFTSSRDALEAFLAAPDDYHLVVTDLTMPEMDGFQLCREIRRLRPRLPVLLCTGFGERASRKGLREAGVTELVLKPVSVHGMMEIMRRVLDEPRKRKRDHGQNSDR